MTRLNEFGQPIGPPLPEWKEAEVPPENTMVGLHTSLSPLNCEHHGEDLFESFACDQAGKNWTYLPYGPFKDRAEFKSWLEATSLAGDPRLYVVIARGQSQAVGLLAWMNIQRDVGSVEIAHVHFSPLLQRRPAATEAVYLLIKEAFNRGYRRCEWKCDSLNAASKTAAERFGFQFEGRFRNARVYKGRSRDTDWYSIIDSEWPRLNKRFQDWLSPENFDAKGQQRKRLREL